ncbi:MAG TPA: hypothetical protein VGQ86_07395 [Candidatus Limnocylindria bacterium]|jgi:YVTN family beta-propeller protein|nr:hypothetical protein [Candidatus Limnocylindria bacterium]
MAGVLRRSLLAVCLLAASACGTVATPSGASSAPRPAAPTTPERVVVEGDSATQIVETPTGTTVATLPGGVLAPSNDLLVSIAADTAGTRVRGVDLTGTTKLDVLLSGDYRLSNAYGAAPSGFSPNGKWLVVVSRDGTDSRFAVIDVTRSTVASVVTLGSRFTFDAIHNDGSAMYLIEHPKPGATTYNVRLYDLNAKVLKPDIIFDKAAIAQFDPTVGLMDGTFHVSVAPKTGDWSYGLYMRPNGKPFVHALNVPGHYAQCIVDLAGAWSPSSMFAMALSATGDRLYVVDTVGGSVSVIDALTQKVSRTTTLGSRGGGDARAASAVVSADGTRLFASSPRGIAIIQTTDLTLKGWVATDLAARSLAISSDGVHLYALAGDTVHVIDLARGRVTAQIAAAPGARALHLLPRS